MLSGPAILRISVILILAGILAAVVQFLLPSPSRTPAPDPAPVAEAPSTLPEPIAPPAPPPAPEPAPQPSSPPPGSAASRPAQMPSDALAFPSEPVQQGQAEIDQAEDNAGPRALALLDLNTASVADLNRLRGGGAIGRAITAKRPYTSVDQLLSKRVLSRAVYEKIKDQVTVR
ncbi:helix-hairpin-helix domain-containing protein [Methylobacterium sp. E-066]|uniref:helix-hairpin-helix domain-containing protein n=1 Tax=Methylobacterium sp. E-066 TaxID=2836584 RepID=UPI0028C43B48|nr:helix-hairpin-helix domain-containing protein [Methylobacterium sp. E-066]